MPNAVFQYYVHENVPAIDTREAFTKLILLHHDALHIIVMASTPAEGLAVSPY
jgi:hypothetical protein